MHPIGEMQMLIACWVESKVVRDPCFRHAARTSVNLGGQTWQAGRAARRADSGPYPADFTRLQLQDDSRTSECFQSPPLSQRTGRKEKKMLFNMQPPQILVREHRAVEIQRFLHQNLDSSLHIYGPNSLTTYTNKAIQPL